MGAAIGLLPAGALIAAPVALIVLRLSRNAGFSGAAFLALAVAAGWLVHDDSAHAIIALGGAAAVLGKSMVQYR